MTDLSHCDPTTRFSGLADVYARCRPTYPAAALDFLQEHCGWHAGVQVVDVGSGTGISARWLAERGLRVLGIEPNAEMRQRAEQEPGAAAGPRPEYRAGRAEATGLPDATVDGVLAAQAFHWFEAAAALAEFHRLLKPAGWVALLWNERDERDPFTAAYGAVFRAEPSRAALEAARGAAGEPLLTCPLLLEAQRVLFFHEQVLDWEGVRGRAFSASYAPREPDAVRQFSAVLEAAFHAHQRNGQVTLRYQTILCVGRRRDPGI